MNIMNIVGPILVFSFGGLALVASIVVIAAAYHTKCWQERLVLLSVGFFMGITSATCLAISVYGILCLL